MNRHEGKKRGRRKLRAALRKHHDQRTRRSDVTRDYLDRPESLEEHSGEERLSGKGRLTRKRTIIGEAADAQDAALPVQPDVDRAACREGRVLSVHGAVCHVHAEDGRQYRCAVRGLLRSLETDQRNVVAAGDRVLFQPASAEEGWIVRIEPRRGVLSRAVYGRRQVIVANVDQLMIIASAAEPPLKPNLIDRMIVCAEQGGIRPVVCINKVDLVDPADLEPLAGVYGQMGYPVLLVSAKTGFGVDGFRRRLAGRQSVVAGQSGVGKSSLLNAVAPQLRLRVGEVSRETLKGRHTTTTAQLLPLPFGGHVVDTPGIRQFQLWDVIPEEVAGWFRDVRPYASLCRFPDCSHTHEADCAVKDAVADGRLDARRYESYCRLLAGEED